MGIYRIFIQQTIHSQNYAGSALRNSHENFGYATQFFFKYRATISLAGFSQNLTPCVVIFIFMQTKFGIWLIVSN
jgi:hypothetical protein